MTVKVLAQKPPRVDRTSGFIESDNTVSALHLVLFEFDLITVNAGHG